MAAVELREGLGQVGARLGQRAAAPRIGRCLLVGRGRLVEPLGPLVVAGDQPPVRVTAHTADQGVGHLGVQPAAHARGRQLGGDLAQQLVAKPPTVGSPRLEHQRVLELVDDVVDLVVAQVDHRAQQAAIHLAADDGGRLHHRHHVRAGAQPGEQRLIQRLGHPGLGEAGHDLFDVERHPVAAVGHRGPVIGRQAVGFSAVISASVCSSVNGARSNTLTGQPAGSHPPGRPVMTTSSRPLAASSSEPRTSRVDAIEPVHILGHHQARTVAQTRQQIALHRLRDQLIELAALGGHRLIAGLGADPQHRRQQRHQGPRLQRTGRHLGFAAAAAVHPVR